CKYGFGKTIRARSRSEPAEYNDLQGPIDGSALGGFAICNLRFAIECNRKSKIENRKWNHAQSNPLARGAVSADPGDHLYPDFSAGVGGAGGSVSGRKEYGSQREEGAEREIPRDIGMAIFGFLSEADRAAWRFRAFDAVSRVLSERCHQTGASSIGDTRVGRAVDRRVGRRGDWHDVGGHARRIAGLDELVDHVDRHQPADVCDRGLALDGGGELEFAGGRMGQGVESDPTEHRAGAGTDGVYRSADARLDARRAGNGLRPHRPRQGLVARGGHLEALPSKRVPSRAVISWSRSGGDTHGI